MVTFVEMCWYVIFGRVVVYASEVLSKSEFDFPFCLSYILSFAGFAFDAVYEIYQDLYLARFKIFFPSTLLKNKFRISYEHVSHDFMIDFQ